MSARTPKAHLTTFTVCGALASLLLVMTLYVAQNINIIDEARLSIETAAGASSGQTTTAPATILWVKAKDGDVLAVTALPSLDTANQIQWDIARAYTEEAFQWKAGEMRLIQSHDCSFWVAPGTSREHLPSDHTTTLYAFDATALYGVLNQSTMVMLGLCLITATILILGGRFVRNQIANAEKGSRDFFANASHELKTPLMAIEGYNAQLQNGFVSLNEGCPVIEREVLRMKRMVDDILELSRVDSMVATPVFAPTDLREIAYDTLTDIAPIATEKGIHLIPELPQELYVVSDCRMLYSILSNMGSNAVRHAQSFVKIHGALYSDTVVITVSNDGESPDETELSHAFDRFYRGPSGQSGLGLALALEYTRLLGGTLTLKSAPHGALCVLTLPCEH